MPVNRPPGPRGLPFLGQALAYQRDPLGFLEASKRDHGDVVGGRMPGFPVVVLHHPFEIQQVLVANQDRYTKGFPKQRAQSPFGKGLIVSDGPLWARQRRLVAPALTRAAIRPHGPQIAATAARWAETLADGTARDAFGAMEALTRRLFVEALGGQVARPRLEAALGELARHFDALVQRPVPIPLAVPTPGNLRFRATLRTLDAEIDALLEAPGELLGRLVAARDEGGAPMPPAQLRDELKSLFLAGNETTALLLTYALALLAREPEAWEAIAAEARDLEAAAAEPMAKLPRALAAISEAARLYPPIHVIAREAIAPDEIRGFPIDPGTLVLISPWITHRDPRWWEAPLAFRPDRWAGGPPPGLPKCAYIPFGAGPRLCVGNHLALIEATIALGAIARAARLEAGSEALPDLAPAMTLRPRGRIDLRFHKR